MKKYFSTGYLFNYPAYISIEISSNIADIPLKPRQDLINVFDTNDTNQESEPYLISLYRP